MTPRPSLAELAAADIQLRPAEAVTVVAEMCRQHARGQIPGIPSPGIIRVTREGQVMAQGPMTREDASVSRAGHLLNDLLPGVDATADYRVSGGLRLVLARALGTLDLPPYASLDEFCAALARFAGPDPVATARELFHRWEARQGMLTPPVAAPALTISDIRRARRATGWSLDDLSAVTDVPAARLRELEWGYVRNWRADEDARGLIENSLPAVDDEDDQKPVTALVPSGPQAIARIEPAVRSRARSGLVSSALAVGVAALLALATFAIVMGSAQGGRPVRAEASEAPAPVREARPIVSSVALAAPGPESPATARPRARPAPQPRRPSARPRSFFNREIFRIVIK